VQRYGKNDNDKILKKKITLLHNNKFFRADEKEHNIQYISTFGY